MSVSDTSDEAKRITIKTHTRTVAKDPNVAYLEERIREHLNTKVKINDKKGRGNISIEYYSKEDLANILEKILK